MGSRDEWKRGTKVSLFSQGVNKWLNGVVYKVRNEGGLNEMLEVHYKKDGKRNKKILPRYSQHLKARVSANKSDGSSSPNQISSDSNGPAKRSPRGLPKGWTEHQDKRNGRFYYYNKAHKKTLWDTDALKNGLISKIKVVAVSG